MEKIITINAYNPVMRIPREFISRFQRTKTHKNIKAKVSFEKDNILKVEIEKTK